MEQNNKEENYECDFKKQIITVFTGGHMERKRGILKKIAERSERKDLKDA